MRSWWTFGVCLYNEMLICMHVSSVACRLNIFLMVPPHRWIFRTIQFRTLAKGSVGDITNSRNQESMLNEVVCVPFAVERLITAIIRVMHSVNRACAGRSSVCDLQFGVHVHEQHKRGRNVITAGQLTTIWIVGSRQTKHSHWIWNYCLSEGCGQNDAGRIWDANEHQDHSISYFDT